MQQVTSAPMKMSNPALTHGPCLDFTSFFQRQLSLQSTGRQKVHAPNMM
jgi:hypothetical protein